MAGSIECGYVAVDILGSPAERWGQVMFVAERAASASALVELIGFGGFALTRSGVSVHSWCYQERDRSYTTT